MDKNPSAPSRNTRPRAVGRDRPRPASLGQMFAFAIRCAVSLYLPGTVPNDFEAGAKVTLITNSLRSSRRPIPYADIRHDAFCASANHTDLRSNIGEFLTGDSIHVSAIVLSIAVNQECVPLCRKNYSRKQRDYLIDLIDYGYRRVLVLDGIPVSRLTNGTHGRVPGFQIGYAENDRHFLYGHINFFVKLTRIAPDVYRIVSFDISSLAPSCRAPVAEPIEDGASFEFSYSVRYELANTTWFTRWDDILTIDYDPKVHWFSISNTLLLVVSFSILIGVILVQTIRHDFSKYSQFLDDEDPLEETGWKLIHGDVFRPPKYANTLAALVGSGLQIAIGLVLVISVAALGFLAPLNTGSMLTAITVITVVVAPFGGFVSSKLTRTIGSGNGKIQYIRSALMFLGPEIASYLMANVIFLYTESSAAATMRGLAELFVTVLSLDLALFGLGFLIGLRVSPFDCPARVNNIPRLVPRQPFFLSPLCTSAIAGVVIFASIYVEVYFILQALWTNLSYYYLFGLLLIVVLAMLVVSAEVAIFAVYLLLCYENHRWWWAAFRIPASVSFVFFAYCIFFMVTVYRPPDRESVAVFLIFSFVIALGLAFANGAVGFLCAFTVVQRMYGALKME